MFKILKKKNKGFTMIELIIVLVLIGLIAAIAVPKYLDVTTKAKEKSLQGALSSIRGALQLQYSKSVLDGTPAYPSLNGTIFQDGAVPTDVITPTNSVQYSAEDPISTFDDNGGWIFNKTTGEVRVNLPARHDW